MKSIPKQHIVLIPTFEFDDKKEHLYKIRIVFAGATKFKKENDSAAWFEEISSRPYKEAKKLALKVEDRLNGMAKFYE